MSKNELDKRIDSICAIPFIGVTLSPSGDLVLCCNSAEYSLGKISDIVSLTEFFNGPRYQKIRETIENGNILEVKGCHWCFARYQKGYYNIAYNANYDWTPFYENIFDSDWHNRKQNTKTPIRFLEYTCSNNCNQACSTCTGFYSSKWSALEKNFSPSEITYFDRISFPRNKISDDDIDKILETLPDLMQISIKGGEPWIDRNNLKILSRLLEVNPKCAIFIVSNMHHLSDEAIDIIKRFKNHQGYIFMGASIDAIGKQYEWIRSTPFEKTLHNIHKFHELSGRPISIVSTLSLHNFFTIDKLVDFFHKDPAVRHISISNPAGIYKYYQYRSLPSDLVRKQKKGYLKKFQIIKRDMERIGSSFNFDLISLDETESIENDFTEDDLKQGLKWISKINSLRGFELEDHVPELRRLQKKISNPDGKNFFSKNLRNYFSSLLN